MKTTVIRQLSDAESVGDPCRKKKWTLIPTPQQIQKLTKSGLKSKCKA